MCAVNVFPVVSDRRRVDPGDESVSDLDRRPSVRRGLSRRRRRELLSFERDRADADGVVIEFRPAPNVARPPRPTTKTNGRIARRSLYRIIFTFITKLFCLPSARHSTCVVRLDIQSFSAPRAV